MSTQDPTRRMFMRQCILGLTVAPAVLTCLTSARAATADLPLLSPDDPAAKKVKYTEDASQAAGATRGNKCGTCALYEGTYNSTQGPCQIFPGKHVKAAGWCSSWAPQI